MNKRKGVDFSSPNSSSSLKVLSWSEIKKSLEEKQKVEFGWSNKLKNVLPQCRLDKEHEQLNESANAIKDSLQNQIAEARLACDEEQSDLSCLNGKIHSMEKEVEQIQKATSDLQEDQTKLQERIKEYQNEISKCQVELNSEEVEMMKQVPKIKSQISLYAKTTGIKWDYNSEHILAGQVVSCIAI